MQHINLFVYGQYDRVELGRLVPGYLSKTFSVSEGFYSNQNESSEFHSEIFATLAEKCKETLNEKGIAHVNFRIVNLSRF
jgi:hypothetical protein